LDLNYSRSWFQTPNSFDTLNVPNVTSGGASSSPVYSDVGNADQHSKIGTVNISPTYTRVIGNNSVWNLGAFLRRDDYNYYPAEITWPTWARPTSRLRRSHRTAR